MSWSSLEGEDQWSLPVGAPSIEEVAAQIARLMLARAVVVVAAFAVVNGSMQVVIDQEQQPTLDSAVVIGCDNSDQRTLAFVPVATDSEGYLEVLGPIQCGLVRGHFPALQSFWATYAANEQSFAPYN